MWFEPCFKYWNVILWKSHVHSIINISSLHNCYVMCPICLMVSFSYEWDENEFDYGINVHEFIKWLMNAGWLSRRQSRKVELLEVLCTLETWDILMCFIQFLARLSPLSQTCIYYVNTYTYVMIWISAICYLWYSMHWFCFWVEDYPLSVWLFNPFIYFFSPRCDCYWWLADM